VEKLPVASVQLLALALERSGAVKDAEAVLRRGQRRHPNDVWLNHALGRLLHKKAEPDRAEAVRFYTAARAVRPEIGHDLAHALEESGRREEAVALFEELCRLRPANASHHNCLGNALKAQGRLDPAIRCYRTAIKCDPKLPQAHHNLGVALKDKGDVVGAIRCYRTAIKSDPKYALAHYALGVVLYHKGDVDGAIRSFRTALECNRKYALAHYNLGIALYAKGDLDGAIRCFRTALECDPKYARAHTSLGVALEARGDVDGAIRCYRTALECEPKYAQAHYNMGNVLKARGDVDGAIRCFRTALECEPKLAQAHTNLGAALLAQGDVDGAIRCFRTAIQCAPKLAPAHGGLGIALVGQGQFAEARQETRRALDLLSARDPLRNYFSLRLAQCEQLLALDKKLAAILKGEGKPADAAECLALAVLCQQNKQLYRASARFYSDAFAAQPKLADNPRTQPRYGAACAAVLAAAGRGKDADKLDAKERTRLRKQALDWLRADLAMWGKLLEKATPQQRTVVQKTLTHWKRDADLTTVRDKEALAQLPEAERAAWEKLWADVATLRKKASEGK
jgi:superkiller protein 3